MAGSPIPREVAQAFLDRGVIPQNVYGMSENSSHQYTLPSDDPETIVATCGRACRAYEIRLWDQENPDREVTQGEIGEIGGRGACLMLGYFDNQQATEESFNREGWFMSGDLGRFDAKGMPRNRRAQEGPDHPRRPQYPPGADRGPGDAPSGGGPRCRVCGLRRAARRKSLPVGDLPRGRRRRARRTSGASPRMPGCRVTTCPSISSRWTRIR